MDQKAKSIITIILKFYSPIILTAILVLIGISLYFDYKSPPYLNDLSTNRKVLSEIQQLTDGISDIDGAASFTTITDVEQLRNQNEIQAEVYADARDGDYVVLFINKMIIYRREVNEIVYEGPSPAQIAQGQAREVAKTIGQAVLDEGLVPEGTRELSIPSLDEILDNEVESLRNLDPMFYEEVRSGDIIAYFSDLNLLVIFRPNNGSGEIINSGEYNVSINTQTN